MENTKIYVTIPIIQGSRFGNGNKETETPLDRPCRENGRKQNTNQTHTQQFRRTMKNRKTKKAVGRGCRIWGRWASGVGEEKQRRKSNGRTWL